MGKNLRGWLAAGAVLALVACGDDTIAPEPELNTSAVTSSTAQDSLAALVRQLTAARGIGPLAKPPKVRPALVQLGQVLAFDKIMSGNRDISCMSCHLPSFGTGDGLTMSIGQGGSGLGPVRTHPQGIFIPRNAPPLFNMHVMSETFWDGRVSQDAAGNFHTPVGGQLTPAMTGVFEFGAISAQPMFPVLSRAEMRGEIGENELGDIDDTDPQATWAGIMTRLGSIPEYRRLFERAYPGQQFDQMTFAHASNAIAGFVLDRLSFNNTPWDRFLAGDNRAMTTTQLQGAKNFMAARCSICHNGAAFTDNAFHNVAVAQLGPGQGDGPGGNDDFGRMRVTGNAADQYAYRTPPLRNVELTAPYGHDGAIQTLLDFVDHYSESDLKLKNYDITQVDPRLRGTLVANTDAILATRDTLLNGVVLSPGVISEVTAFMNALTDPRARNLTGVVPLRVPSGLPVDGR